MATYYGFERVCACGCGRKFSVLGQSARKFYSDRCYQRMRPRHDKPSANVLDGISADMARGWKPYKAKDHAEFVQRFQARERELARKHGPVAVQGAVNRQPEVDPTGRLRVDDGYGPRGEWRQILQCMRSV